MRVLIVAMVAGVGFGVASADLGTTQQAGRRNVLVTVLDQDAMPVRDLRASDFIVRGPDGGNLDVQAGSVATDPPAIVIVPIGFSRSMVSDARGILREAVSGIRASFPDARVGLMVRDGASTPLMHNVRSESAALESEIGSFFAHINAVLLDSLIVAAQTLSSEASARRVILSVYIHGSPDVDGLAPTRVAQQIRASNASLWVLEVGSGLPVGSSDGQVLAHVPIASGGRRVTASVPRLVPLVKETVELIAGQYRVVYNAPPSLGEVAVRVGVRRSAVTVLAPSWK